MNRQPSRARAFVGSAIGTIAIVVVVVMLAAQVVPTARVGTGNRLTPAAGPITLTPPYTANILFAPVTWAVGVGSLTFPINQAVVGTGAATIDSHALAKPSGGTYGTDANEAGFSQTYACGGPCAGATTVTFNWGGTGAQWYTHIDISCPDSSAFAEFTAYGQVWQGATLLGQITWTPSILISNTNPTAVTAHAALAPIAVVLAPGTIAPGNTYTFVSYLWGNTYAHCGGGVTPNQVFSEVDVGNQYPGATLVSIVIT